MFHRYFYFLEKLAVVGNTMDLLNQQKRNDMDNADIKHGKADFSNRPSAFNRFNIS